ncbi:arsenate reductase (glutaredoxin) [Pontibacter sp. JAM-7]|uniref:arsenate reductase (glutaredoxin) n=1 Tax=Pontibacter sp. JAM-7 TaxID=3366581 RepID=UPI003AF76B29
MSDITLYHNPRCSKSLQTLALLEEHGIKPTIRKYLEDSPSAEELKTVLGYLGITPRDLLRKKESEYAEMGLKNPDLSDAQIIQAMVECPKLIERPILIKGTQARIGRPPETVLEII